jgi:hypothetical protein
MVTLISEQDVSPAQLSVLLEQAVIAHTVEDDGSIRVHEPSWFPFWVHQGARSGSLILSTYTEFRDDVPELDRLRLANQAMLQSNFIAVTVTEQRLCFESGQSCRGAMVHEHFIRGCREFASEVTRLVRTLDPDNSLTKRLSEVCNPVNAKD